MCKWICFCFYPKEDHKVVKKTQEQQNEKGDYDKNKESDQKTGADKSGQQIESFYDTNDKKSVSGAEADSPLAETPNSVLITTYNLPVDNCRTTRELMTHLGFEIQTQVGKGGFGWSGTQMLSCQPY